MIEIPDPSSVDRVADWIELAVCVERRSFSRPAVASILEQVAGNEPSEAFVSSLWRELMSRQRLYVVSPFLADEAVVQPTQRRSKPSAGYIACLLLSLFGVQGLTTVPASLFERLTRLVVERYIGGKALLFGSRADIPGSEESEEESSIKRRVKRLTEILNERFVEGPPDRFNDRGVDVVGWIPFEDKRSSQVVILTQCAAGHNWKDKLSVPWEAWCQYIHWGYNPLIAFSVPCIITERDWHESSTDKGILFDRARIVNLLPKRVPDKKLEKDLVSWVNEELSRLNQ